MHTEKDQEEDSITRMRTVGYSYNLRVKEKSERTAGTREGQSYGLKAERRKREEQKRDYEKTKFNLKFK